MSLNLREFSLHWPSALPHGIYFWTSRFFFLYNFNNKENYFWIHWKRCAGRLCAKSPKIENLFNRSHHHRSSRRVGVKDSFAVSFRLFLSNVNKQSCWGLFTRRELTFHYASRSLRPLTTQKKIEIDGRRRIAHASRLKFEFQTTRRRFLSFEMEFCASSMSYGLLTRSKEIVVNHRASFEMRRDEIKIISTCVMMELLEFHKFSISLSDAKTPFHGRGKRNQQERDGEGNINIW